MQRYSFDTTWGVSFADDKGEWVHWAEASKAIMDNGNRQWVDGYDAAIEDVLNGYVDDLIQPRLDRLRDEILREWKEKWQFNVGMGYAPSDPQGDAT